MPRGQQSKRPWTRRVFQPLLLVVAILSGLTVVAASLRRRPDVEPPADVAAHFREGDFQRTLATLNSQLAQQAAAAELATASGADNLAIARRLSLALVGSGLSLEEVRALAAVPEDQQVEWWTDYLLQDQRWADYFAERFSRAFVGTNEGPFILFRRRKFRMWLSEQFAKGTPYDEIVREMLSAEGLWTDTPQVNFVTATMDQQNGRGDPVRLAGRTARAFLAQRIDCLQCHDDFLGDLNFGTSAEPVDGIQEHFHALAAFYSGTGLGKVVFGGIREDGSAYEYQYLGESEEVVVDPDVPFCHELLPAEGKPRDRLARWVTHPQNEAFSRATVNRVWALMFSRPLVTPVDSIPLHGPLPPMLDTLAQDFATHGFNLKRLIRLIAKSDAFQRSSRAEFMVTPEHEACWAVFPLSQLRPEQVAGSVIQASKLTALDASSSIFTQLKSFGDLQDFLKRFGDRGEDEFDSDAVTITQRLIMMNGNMVQERTKQDLVNNASSRIATLVGDDRQAIELVYLSALNRSPSAVELEVYLAYLKEHGVTNPARDRALGDIYWAIINSTEFSWNH